LQPKSNTKYKQQELQPLWLEIKAVHAVNQAKFDTIGSTLLQIQAQLTSLFALIPTSTSSTNEVNMHSISHMNTLPYNPYEVKLTGKILSYS